jgi:hypothetical protein
MANGYNDNRELVQTFAQVLQEVKNSMRNQSREDEFVGAKVDFRNLCSHKKSRLIPTISDNLLHSPLC